jgi:outer membrane protein assembly factor BamB
MMKRIAGLCAVILCAGLVGSGGGAAADETNWPQWRGPHMTGAAPAGNPPVEWSETKNVKWKIEIPGKGSSTPVIWGDKIFVLTAVATGEAVAPAAQPEPGGAAQGERRGPPRGPQPTHVQQFTVLAISRATGKTLWKSVVHEELPHEGHHPTNTWASHSAITDGQNVFAFFGSRGMYCLDMNGKKKWAVQLGKQQTRNGFGEGSTPALYRDRLIVLWDHEGEDFIAAFDKQTGKELWRTPREEPTTWSTPLVIEHGGNTQVVTTGTNAVRSYDFETGKLLWTGPGLTANSIPSPVHADGIVYTTSGFRGNALHAIKLAEAKGDIAGTGAIAWQYDRDTPYVPSPLLYNGLFFMLKSNNGIITAFDAKSGEKMYGPERLEAVPNVYASPTGAGGRVYVVGREGGAAVLEAGRELKVLANNKLEDGFDASPVVVGNELYLRGMKYLYRISTD